MKNLAALFFFSQGFIASTDEAVDMAENCGYSRLLMTFHLVASDKITPDNVNECLSDQELPNYRHERIMMEILFTGFCRKSVLDLCIRQCFP